MEETKRIRMFAGPNGSGKSTLIHSLAKEFTPNGFFHLRSLVNADDFLRDLQSGNGIHLDHFGVNLTTDDLRAALSKVGRLAQGHRFLEQTIVVNNILTAPPDVCDSYAAATVADVIREHLLNAGRSFAFETVMSHVNKVEFFGRARDAGYRTYLYFVALDSVDANRNRVMNRMALGGHDVPEQKIRERYDRSLALLGKALTYASRAFLFDNSVVPVWLAELTPNGKMELRVAPEVLPTWFRNYVMPNHVL